METLAAAIVGALIAGTREVASEAVKDAYASAKRVLKRLVPNFDSEKATDAGRGEASEELAQRLQGLVDKERAELVQAFRELALAAGLQDQANMLDRFTVRNIQAGESVNVSLQGGGETVQEFDNIVGRSGNVTIKTEMNRG